MDTAMLSFEIILPVFGVLEQILAAAVGRFDSMWHTKCVEAMLTGSFLFVWILRWIINVSY